MKQLVNKIYKMWWSLILREMTNNNSQLGIRWANRKLNK